MNSTRCMEREVVESFGRANTNHRSPAMRGVIEVLFVSSAVVGSMPGFAQTSFGAEWLLDDLEKAFWACDYGATISLVDFYGAMPFSQFTEALRQQKIDGDFDAVLVWWRQHKDAKYQELSKVGGVPGPSVTP